MNHHNNEGQIEVDADILPVEISSSPTQVSSSNAGSAGESNSSGDMLLLYCPSDEQWLTPYLCILRQNIEVFAATKQDVQAKMSAGGNKVAPVVGQCGIRCIHCKSLPFKERAKASESYPSSVRNVHQSVRNFQRNHWDECQVIPQSVRDAVEYAKAGSQKSRGSSGEYWIKSCTEHLGMVDATDGRGGIFLAGTERADSIPKGLAAATPSASPKSSRGIIKMKNTTKKKTVKKAKPVRRRSGTCSANDLYADDIEIPVKISSPSTSLNNSASSLTNINSSSYSTDIFSAIGIKPLSSAPRLHSHATSRRFSLPTDCSGYQARPIAAISSNIEAGYQANNFSLAPNNANVNSNAIPLLPRPRHPSRRNSPPDHSVRSSSNTNEAEKNDTDHHQAAGDSHKCSSSMLSDVASSSSASAADDMDLLQHHHQDIESDFLKNLETMSDTHLEFKSNSMEPTPMREMAPLPTNHEVPRENQQQQQQQQQHQSSASMTYPVRPSLPPWHLHHNHPSLASLTEQARGVTPLAVQAYGTYTAQQAAPPPWAQPMVSASPFTSAIPLQGDITQASRQVSYMATTPPSRPSSSQHGTNTTTGTTTSSAQASQHGGVPSSSAAPSAAVEPSSFAPQQGEDSESSFEEAMDCLDEMMSTHPKMSMESAFLDVGGDDEEDNGSNMDQL